MKLIFISVVFYIEAVFYDFLLSLVMRMKYSLAVTAFLARKAERIGERLKQRSETLQKLFGGM